MKYQELYKTYYNKRKMYESLYESRFHNEVTVHLDFHIADYQCFFLPTIEMIQLISSIYQSVRKLHSIETDLPGIAKNQFKTSALIEEIQLSNEIEGVRSTKKDISETIQAKEKNSQNRRLFGLVNKYITLSKNDELSVLTCNDIRNIYDELLKDEILANDPGNLPDGTIFRKNTVKVQNEHMKVLHQGLYPEDKIISAMQKALRIFNDSDMDPLIRISIFHYLFGYIHPFYDGNGRTSRFLSSYMLSKELDPLISYNLSPTIKRNSKSYYKSFDTTNDKINRGDLTGFILQFLGLIYDSVQDLIDNLEDKKIRLEHYTSVLSSKNFNSTTDNICYILIQNTLFSEMEIKVNELASYAGVSVNTVYNRLRRELEPFILKSSSGYRIDFEKFDWK